MTKSFLKIISVVAVILGFSLVTIAEENSEFAEKARERRYVGGADESDLKVQRTLTANPKAKSQDPDETNEGF
jgi:hypothetical protein